METEHEIVAMVYAAKENIKAADDLVRKYLPFIKSETAKFLGRIPLEGEDDEIGIAMFAFHEAAMAYEKGRGAFLSFAAKAIKNRLIDYQRREKRHSQNLSLDEPLALDEGKEETLLDRVDTGRDEIAERAQIAATKEEINEFAFQLGNYGLSLADIAENCPKQERTFAACQKALAFAKENPFVLEQLISTGKVPMAAIVSASGVDRKTLERHRKYLLAILLAYTNGFEIIRGHLAKVSKKGGNRK